MCLDLASDLAGNRTKLNTMTRLSRCMHADDPGDVRVVRAVPK